MFENHAELFLFHRELFLKRYRGCYKEISNPKTKEREAG